jgi:membrane protease YdiL (CAAX protease family)
VAVRQTTPAPQSPLSPSRWDPRSFGLIPSLFFLLILGAAVLASVSISVLVLRFDPATIEAVHAGKPVLTAGLLWAQAAGYVPLIAAAIYGLPIVARRSLAELGFTWPKGKEISAGLAGGAFMFVAVELAAAVQTNLTKIESHERIIDMLTGTTNSALIAGLVLLACIVAPLVEELLFRGFVFNAVMQFAYAPAIIPRWLRQWKILAPPLFAPPIAAAVVSGIAFGAAHAEPSAFFPLACGGFLLALVYYRTGSLASSMIAHSLFNVANLILVLTVRSTA